MTNVFDRAQEREEEMRSDALAEHQRRSHGHVTQVSAEFCTCGEAIPEGRRKAIPGVQTCVECQTDIERSGRWDWGMSE